MKIRLFLIAALIALTGFTALNQITLADHGSGSSGGGGGAKIIARLVGSPDYPSAKGKAAYKSKGGEREFQVEVENLSSLKGKSLNVFVNGARVGRMKVNTLGEARLNLNSDRGDAVPNVATGTTVEVKTGNGALIASGSF